MYQQHHRQHNRRTLLKEQQLQPLQTAAATTTTTTTKITTTTTSATTTTTTTSTTTTTHQSHQAHTNRPQTRSYSLQSEGKESPALESCGPPNGQRQHDYYQQHHHPHHHQHQHQRLQQTPPQPQQPQPPAAAATATTTTTTSQPAAAGQQQQQQQSQSQQLLSSFESRIQPSMAYQHKHALHRLRRLKKRAPHRDLVISFVPRLRTSIINRLDFFNRYSKQEQEVLSCFDFLDELVLNYCDGGIESPRYSQKLYQSLIYELI